MEKRLCALYKSEDQYDILKRFVPPKLRTLMYPSYLYIPMMMADTWFFCMSTSSEVFLHCVEIFWRLYIDFELCFISHFYPFYPIVYLNLV